MWNKIIIALCLLVAPFSLLAEEVVGKIQSISVQGKVIKYLNPKTKQVTVIKFTQDTALESAEDFDDLTVNTKFKATVNEQGIATKIKRILVKLPAERVIDTDGLEELMESGTPYFLGDARPAKIYDLGHIPSALPTPAGELAKNLNWLPKDKATPLVFYCGGVTCPLSPKAMKIAMKHGYTNVRAYVEGYPAWKGEVYPAHVNAGWLAKNIDPHHVILDVRDTAETFVKGAVHLPTSSLAAMHQQWNKDKYPVKKRMILGIRDKKAPIVIIADSHDSDEAIEAYEYLTFWKYQNVAILNGGQAKWQGPKGVGTIATTFDYVKKPVKGAVEESVFVTAAKTGDATIIDVRSSNEYENGHLAKSIHIPLDQLDQHLAKIPKTGQVIVHCAAGARAALAYASLVKHGYDNVKFLNDSFEAVAKENNLKLL